MEENNNKKPHGFIIYSIFIAILIFTIGAVVSQQTKKNLEVTAQNDTANGDETNTDGDKHLQAVLKEVDGVANDMTLQDTNSGQEIIVSYNGGTNLLDKYDQVIAATQLTVGEIVDAYLSEDQSKLTKLQISKKTWEYKGVNKWSIDTYQKTMDIADTKYKYNNNLVLAGDNEFLDVFGLNEKDQLAVRGFDKNIYSIVVTKGHGTITLEDYADFIGGTAYIGNQEILPVVKGMVITVREGSHEIILENNKLIGYKTVEVARNKNVVVNMGEFKKPPVQYGLVSFEILPQGADLYIDGLLQAYANPIELEYGEHTIKAALNGYTTYTGMIKLSEANKSVMINLAESPATDTTGDGTNTNGTNTNGTGTSTTNGVTGATNNNGSSGNNNSSATDGTSQTNAGDTQANAGNYIFVQSPVGASVYFNAEYKGTAPVKFPKVTGTHYIILIKTGFQTKTYTVEIADNGKDAYFSYPDMSK